jgi:hypothetical protein
MRRLVRLCLLGTSLMALMIPVSSASAVTVGISDQQASTFTNPLFAPLKLKVARYITPYDVLDEPSQKSALDAWLQAARSAHQRILISFEHSRLPSKYNKAPSVALYRRKMTAFKKQYGSVVNDISPWNEVNVCQAPGRTEGQPAKICKSSTGPKLVAQYYGVARRVFKGKKIVGIDILDGKNVSPAVSYLKKFKRYARPLPKYWGIHNYSDTNRGSTSRTSRLIQTIGLPKAQIWLTETGGQLKLRGRDFGQTYAANALKCMFSMPKKFRQIGRLYIYQFNGADQTNDFDAGLIGPDQSKREGYAVVEQRTSGACHA